MNAEASFCRSGDAAATGRSESEERGGHTEQDSSQLVSRGERWWAEGCVIVVKKPFAVCPVCSPYS